MILIHLVVW